MTESGEWGRDSRFRATKVTRLGSAARFSAANTLSIALRED